MGRIAGAQAMPREVLARYRLNGHIERLLAARGDAPPLPLASEA